MCYVAFETYIHTNNDILTMEKQNILFVPQIVVPLLMFASRCHTMDPSLTRDLYLWIRMTNKVALLCPSRDVHGVQQFTFLHSFMS